MSSDDPYSDGPPPPPQRGKNTPGEGFDAIDRSATLIYDTSAERPPAKTPGPSPSGPPPLHEPPRDPENITSTGFIPSETFSSRNKLQAIDGPAKTKETEKKSSPKLPLPDWMLRSTQPKSIEIGNQTIRIPSMTWAEDTDPTQRLLYAGGGLIAGVLFGGILGILNALFQGWTIPQGTNQIFFLAGFLGLVFAPMAALRPSRVDRLLARIGISDD